MFFLLPTMLPDIAHIVVAAVLGITIAFLSYKLHLVTFGGSAAVFILAVIIYGIGRWNWTVPILAFFLLSSLLSRIGKTKKQNLERIVAKSEVRDEGQVFANGGVAGILVLLWYLFPGHFDIYYLFLASISAVTADTWATEIGTLSGRSPRSIITFKVEEPGTSGGVSLMGFVGGAAGSVIVIAISVPFSPVAIPQSMFIKLIAAGTIGSVCDSILGATVQARYKNNDMMITEQEQTGNIRHTLVHGIRGIDNDLVNWACALCGAIGMYLMLTI